jgi:hypothetical protein
LQFSILSHSEKNILGLGGQRTDVFIYICMHIYVFIHNVHTYIHTYIHVYGRIVIIHICICIYTYSSMHMYTYTYIYKYMYTCIYGYIHTYINIHIHTCNTYIPLRNPSINKILCGPPPMRQAAIFPRRTLHSTVKNDDDFKKKPRNPDLVWSFFAAGRVSDTRTK